MNFSFTHSQSTRKRKPFFSYIMLWKSVPPRKGGMHTNGGPRQLNNSFFLRAQSRQNIPITRLVGGRLQIVLTLEDPHNEIEAAKEAHHLMWLFMKSLKSLEIMPCRFSWSHFGLGLTPALTRQKAPGIVPIVESQRGFARGSAESILRRKDKKRT